MPESAGRAIPARDPNLVVAAVYERSVAASLDAVWENVFDWEHLPWLHDQAFSSIDLRDAGEWGWHADVGFPGGAAAEIELVVDLAASHYVARTVSGAGAPGEIWTHLDPVDADRTEIRVEFCMQPMDEDALAQVGAAYVALYSGLWDQDESMMRTRVDAFAARDRARAAGVSESLVAPVELGPWSDLAGQLPRVVEFGGRGFRLVELEGRPVVHSVECPHWLGPLDAAPLEGSVVVCPWHGYRFDIETGECTSGQALRLRRPPRIEVDPGTGLVTLSDPADSRNRSAV